jgi:hypothetical protein
MSLPEITDKKARLFELAIIEKAVIENVNNENDER